MAWIIWLVAAPGVSSQGGGSEQENGEQLCSELLALREGAHRDGERGLEAQSPAHLWPSWWDCGLRDEPAQHLGGCFLSLLLISDMGFNPSTIRHFLSSGDPAVFFMYFLFLPALRLLAITAAPGSYLWLLEMPLDARGCLHFPSYIVFERF